MLRFKLSQRPNGEFFPLDEGLFAGPRRSRSTSRLPEVCRTLVLRVHARTCARTCEIIEANCYFEVLEVDAAAILDVR